MIGPPASSSQISLVLDQDTLQGVDLTVQQLSRNTQLLHHIASDVLLEQLCCSCIEDGGNHLVTLLHGLPDLGWCHIITYLHGRAVYFSKISHGLFPEVLLFFLRPACYSVIRLGLGSCSAISAL